MLLLAAMEPLADALPSLAVIWTFGFDPERYQDFKGLLTELRTSMGRLSTALMMLSGDFKVSCCPADDSLCFASQAPCYLLLSNVMMLTNHDP